MNSDLDFDLDNLSLDFSFHDDVNSLEEKKEAQAIEESIQALQELSRAQAPPPPPPPPPLSTSSSTLLEEPPLPYWRPSGEYHVRENYSPTIPTIQKLALIKEELANTGKSLVYEPTVLRIFKGNELTQMMERLDKYGFCIMEISTYENLRLNIQNDVVNLFRSQSPELFNIHNSHEFYGVATKDKNQLVNPLLYNPFMQLLLNNLVPTIQSLAQLKTNQGYRNQQWLANAQFPILNLRGEAEELKRKRGRPKANHSQGTDLETALYFTPYLNEYWQVMDTAETQKSPPQRVKYPNEMEHLRIIMNVASPLSNNVMRIVPGMHKIFDILVDMIRHDELLVENGEFQHYGFDGQVNQRVNHNPLPFADTYYRLSEATVKNIFAPFLLNVTIPENCVGIFNPKLALGYVLPSPCILWPLSIWPKPENPEVHNFVSRARFSEYKTWHLNLPLTTLTQGIVNNQGSYVTHRRVFYRNYGRAVQIIEDDKVLEPLLTEYRKQATQPVWNMALENHLIYGYPTLVDTELSHTPSQQYLKQHKSNQNRPFIEEFDSLCQQFPTLNVGLVSFTPPCEGCGAFATIVMEATIKQKDQIYTWKTICFDCFTHVLMEAWIKR